VLACAIRLRELTAEGKLVMDDKRLILKEYMANLRSAGQPGNGDAFLKWVLTNHSNPARCELVSITPVGSGFTDFAEFPTSPALKSFHGDDRKFIAVSIAHPDHPRIWQAVDTEWWQLRDELNKAGVSVDFLCPEDMQGLTAG